MLSRHSSNQRPRPEYGREGEIAFGNNNRVSAEMQDACEECAAAWASKPGQFIDGPVVIFVRDVTYPRGVYAPQLGITTPRPTNADLCLHPRFLTAADVNGSCSFVIEPNGFGYRGDQKQGSTLPVLAHELGHQLLLFHGNGLDDDLNGKQPPEAGQRLFDSECDSHEYSVIEMGASGSSLMGAIAGDRHLTSLQIELARAAALAWPNHSELK